MIHTTLEWMEKQNKKYGISGRTLDVGSRDINGNPRHLFSDYLGADLQAGENVDLVVNAYNLSRVFGKGWFDVVLCLSTLEHILDMGRALKGMKKVLRKGGYFYVSVPSINFPLHDFPKDYWRFTRSAVEEFVMKGYQVLEINEYQTKSNKFTMIDCLGQKQ